MERTSKLTNNHGQVFKDHQRAEDMDDLISTGTEVVTRLSQKADLVDNDDITLERRDEEEGLSVFKQSSEEGAKNVDTATARDDKTEWY